MHDYPAELMLQVEEARKRKKTAEEVIAFIQPFLKVAADKCGASFHDGKVRSPGVFGFDLHGHFLRLSVAHIRVQGDEEHYMWEPGVPWRGGATYIHPDDVKVEYATSELKHKGCPCCECVVDYAESSGFTTPEDFARWLDELKEG
jgi:hypothetical protein